MADHPALPSKVMDKKLIQSPEGNVVDSEEEWNMCGKWMLHHPQADLDFLDSAWTVLQQLVHDETLILLKSTTGLVASEGVSIYCFTRPGKQAAKQAASAISGKVDFRGIMYYKLNKQTPQRIAGRYVGENPSIYMRTFRGGFYNKRNGIWIRDDEDTKESIAPIDSKFCKQKYSETLMPSINMGNAFWNYPVHKRIYNSSFAEWFLFCSCEDDGKYLAEADRVWLVAKQLIKEGLFVGMTLKRMDDAKSAEVRLYISENCNVYSSLAACNRIFKETCFRTVMYFREKADRRYSYKYTSGGELYMKTEYAEVYCESETK